VSSLRREDGLRDELLDLKARRAEASIQIERRRQERMAARAEWAEQVAAGQRVSVGAARATQRDATA
jgi:hypothetical protein